MLPIDLIIVRHGESEGNVADKASRRGDNQFFTPESRDRHSRTFRLTDRGIRQAEAAGEWIRTSIPMPLDRFYVSDYVRAEETAARLKIPNARWRKEFHLRERDKALMDNMPADEQRRHFGMEVEQYEDDPFLAYPAGGGESIAIHCLRLKAGIIEHWSRKCFDKRVLCVSHGHVMRGLQLELEGLNHDDFIRLNDSEDPADKILNCQIFWYSRRDPDDPSVMNNHHVAVRSVCPYDKNGQIVDNGWRRIVRRTFTNEELLAEVEQYPRHINCT